MSTKESFLYPSILRSFSQEVSLFDIEELSQPEQDLHFAMRCNGFFMARGGQWIFDPNITKSFDGEFRGTRISFFGPNAFAETSNFFSGKDPGRDRFIHAFDQQPFTSVIRKYRQVDEDLAARIAFVFGGIVRYLITRNSQSDKLADKMVGAVKFASRMTMLGEVQSAEAIAAAMAMYVISGGSMEEDKQFSGRVYHMAEAVKEDQIVTLETKDLGLSQVRRLRTFLGMIQAGQQHPFPSISEYEMAFDGFPTVGAEFHFNPDAAKEHPNFWQRLALLNMSQYRRGSYVQLSRNDRDVIEVRMNPSIYPITIANWKHYRLLLPELNQAFFTLTLNRATKDFIWNNEEDKDLLNKLRALGMISYAGLFVDVPHTEKPEEVGFGTIYLGQTVKIDAGEYKFTGNWGGGEGQYGQLGVYTGFGDNLPILAYYLSMALANPDILQSTHRDFWFRIKTLKDALALTPSQRRYISEEIQNRIESDKRLNQAFESGNRILELLNP